MLYLTAIWNNNFNYIKDKIRFKQNLEDILPGMGWSSYFVGYGPFDFNANNPEMVVYQLEENLAAAPLDQVLTELTYRCPQFVYRVSESPDFRGETEKTTNGSGFAEWVDKNGNRLYDGDGKGENDEGARRAQDARGFEEARDI